MRYLQTDLLYQGASKSAIATLKSLGSDPQYIGLCEKGKRFMARLTPKIEPKLALKYFENRDNGLESEIAICHFLENVGSGRVLGNLIKTISIHDYWTQCHRKDLKLY